MEPQRLKAGQGWEWIKQAWGLFLKSPLMWLGIFGALALFSYYAPGIAVFRFAIPGKIVSTFVLLSPALLPIFLVGLFYGCDSLEAGGKLRVSHLFKGFKRNSGELITLGGIIVISFILSSLISIKMFGNYPSDPYIRPLFSFLSASGASTINGNYLLATLITVLLLPISMALVFAPFLIAFHNCSIPKALALSLFGFLKNIVAFLIFSLAIFSIFFIISLIALVPFGKMGSVGHVPFFLAQILFKILLLTSLYAAYHDIFPTTKSAVGAG